MSRINFKCSEVKMHSLWPAKEGFYDYNRKRKLTRRFQHSTLSGDTKFIEAKINKACFKCHDTANRKVVGQ